jgi:NTP pyrophosphatase (non-canonical NTP hydrolase)
MDINELTKKVFQVENLYHDFDKKNGNKKWAAEESYVGLVSDVGDLGRLILAKEGFRDGPDDNKNLGRELAEILCSILFLAKKYNIDLEKSFIEEINNLEKKLLK